MAEAEPLGARIGRWMGSWGSIVAPVTVLTALLFYFGYVSARSQYAYFGIDVDAIGLDTQDYVMRSPQPLLAPLLVLTLLGLGLLTLHTRIEARLAAAVAGDSARRQVIRTWGRSATRVGAVLMGAGILLLLGYSLVQRWTIYPLVTPLLLAIGGALVGYAARIPRRMRGSEAPTGGSASLWHATIALISVTVVASIFWATATIAQWSGRGQAHEQARNLDHLPRVILDTKEPLYLRDPVVEETRLQMTDGQEFRYRYRRLRLLIVGNDRMFLVPERWSASNATLIVPMDDSVRIRFQFQNQPPG